MSPCSRQVARFGSAAGAGNSLGQNREQVLHPQLLSTLLTIPRRLDTSDLGSDNLAEPLTNSANRPGDGEKRLPVAAAGAHIWPAMADAETHGETENARNVGQMGTCGNGCAVNKLRGKRCREGNWLPERNRVTEWVWRIEFRGNAKQYQSPRVVARNIETGDVWGFGFQKPASDSLSI